MPLSEAIDTVKQSFMAMEMLFVGLVRENRRRSETVVNKFKTIEKELKEFRTALQAQVDELKFN